MDDRSYAWTLVDKVRWPRNLAPDDVCYFFYEYTPRRGKWFSQANMVVRDYKASRYEMESDPELSSRKESAIGFYTSILGSFFESFCLPNTNVPLTSLRDDLGLVPVPPSHAPGSPDYDDRNARTCTLLSQRYGFSVCRDVETAAEVGSSHLGGPRTVERTYNSLVLTGRAAHGCKHVFVIDDVLASGAHYAAIRQLLRENGYSMFMCGMFLARIP